MIEFSISAGSNVNIMTGSTDDKFNLLGTVTGSIDGGAGNDTLWAKSTNLTTVTLRNIEYLDTQSTTLTVQQINNFKNIIWSGNSAQKIELILHGNGGSLDFLSKITGNDSVYVKASSLSSAVTITASAKSDTIVGSLYNDVISGGAGNDTISGGNGNDTLIGGAAADILTGGAGKDVFSFASWSDSPSGGSDQIKDFSHGTDLIKLSQIDANSKVAGDQAFKLIGSSGFDGMAGEIRYANGHLYGDVNGDKIADFDIALLNVTTVTASDFIL